MPNGKLTAILQIWMGTHQNGPAHLFSETSKPLLSLISSNPKHYLGDALLKKWPDTTHVPYLFKILSIEKALPLQVHPDRALAEELAKQDPETYVDPNHKPEIAVCIGEPLDGGSWGEGIAFTGFVGFQPLDSIREYIRTVPELREAIGDENAVDAFVSNPSKDMLKKLYASLLRRPQDAVTPLVHTLVDRLSKTRSGTSLSPEVSRLVHKLHEQYPGDVGVFSPFFLNFLKLKRGEAVYIGADEVHAYLEGDIIECMAVSDNVMNAAFAPPDARQTPEFVRALTFTARDADTWRLPHETYKKSGEGKTQVYAPPLEEFVVLGTKLRKGEKETLGAVSGPTIGIVTSGKMKVAVKGEMLTLDAGGIVYIVPGREISVDVEDGSEAEMWWAAADV